MTAFLITWSSSANGWPHRKLVKLVEKKDAEGAVTTQWKFQAFRQAQVGDQVFLLKQGNGPKGIFGYGKIVGRSPYRKKGGDGTQGVAQIEFRQLVDPLSLLLVSEDATRAILSDSKMRSQASGVPLSEEEARNLEGLLESEGQQQIIVRSTGAPPAWTMQPSEQINRKALHEIFQGSGQSGISPSAVSPNVFIFSDAARGQRHGYIDSWQDDGCFHYTGEGQRGDQRMTGGNAAVLNHKQQGRSLRVFSGAGGVVRYIDEFEVDNSVPYYMTDAAETGGGAVRSVIVFRLRPMTIYPQAPANSTHRAITTEVSEVAIEEQHTERMFVQPNRELYEAERREARLVLRFKDFLARQGHKPTRLRVLPEGEAKPLYSDLYVPELGLIVEAKGTVERGSIRMALGQLRLRAICKRGASCCAFAQ